MRHNAVVFLAAQAGSTVIPNTQRLSRLVTQMKHPDRNSVSRMDALPNIGKAIAKDLELIGIDHPEQLVGMSPFELYDKLCSKKGRHVDHCVIDILMSAVDFMEGGEPKPWWQFTAKRKQILARKDLHPEALERGSLEVSELVEMPARK